MNINHILAVVRYEFMIHWRQRATLVITISLVVLPLLFALFIRSELTGGAGFFADVNVPDSVEYSRTVTGTVQWFAWAAINLILTIMAPLITSAIIPKDRQLKVREIFDALPVTPSSYLAGKLLAAWAVLFTALLSAMAVVIAGYRLILGTVDLPTVLPLWLIGGGSLILLNTGLVVLLAAGLSSRRAAYSFAAVFILVTLVFYIRGSIDLTNIGVFDWWAFWTPDRIPISQYFLFDSIGNFMVGLPGVPTVDPGVVWKTILAGLAELALGWAAARRLVNRPR
jgi:ABC-type transport system involved in multi-copper enzyme maturation permease subunit